MHALLQSYIQLGGMVELLQLCHPMDNLLPLDTYAYSCNDVMTKSQQVEQGKMAK